MMRVTDFIRILVALRDGGEVVWQSNWDAPDGGVCSASHRSGLQRAVRFEDITRCVVAGLIVPSHGFEDGIRFRHEYRLTAAGINAAKHLRVTLARALATKSRITNS
ncbi:hypothetical protein SAMN05216338_1001880 [Bradyrhizobium sp. Rc2d]|uniref:hypothetical protein n=1 Tax=Bradyrhizobium sp. Rc2d TaxID=1855321 RepID=UPI00088AA885|nr:hypothetical protein [Bradyrhizobium sp. Rc2d]SDG60469.1 hypothetical protein SAMN05216338_1001880 [Bradyrhizobium sp. Rc2d]